MKPARRRLAALERKSEAPAAGGRRYTHMVIELDDFPGWDVAMQMGYKPGDDLPWHRKSP